MNTLLRAIVRGVVYRLLPRSRFSLVAVGAIALLFLVLANGARAGLDVPVKGTACPSTVAASTGTCLIAWLVPANVEDVWLSTWVRKTGVAAAANKTEVRLCAGGIIRSPQGDCQGLHAGFFNPACDPGSYTATVDTLGTPPDAIVQCRLHLAGWAGEVIEAKVTNTTTGTAVVGVSFLYGTVASGGGSSSGLTDAQLRATSVPVSVSNFPASQAVTCTDCGGGGGAGGDVELVGNSYRALEDTRHLLGWIVGILAAGFFAIAFWRTFGPRGSVA